MDIVPQKRCSHCNEFYPPTTEYFHTNNKRQDKLSVWCKICANGNRKRLAKERPEVREAYKERNRERIRKVDNDWYAAHPEQQTKKRKAVKEWREDHLDYARQKSRDYYKEHVDEFIERNKQWAKDNPERYRAIMENRYAREKNAEGIHTAQDLDAIYEELSGRCAYCGISIYWGVFRDVHVDHIIPLSKGGTNWPDNITLACRECNCSKSDKLLPDWLASRGW